VNGCGCAARRPVVRTPAPALTAGAELTAVFHPYPGGKPRRIAVGGGDEDRTLLARSVAGQLDGGAVREAEPWLLERSLANVSCRWDVAVRRRRQASQVVLVDARSERCLPGGADVGAGDGARWRCAVRRDGLVDGDFRAVCAVAEPGGDPEVLA